MLHNGCGREVSPVLVWRQFVAGISASKLTGKYGTITKRCNLLMKSLTVLDKMNNLIVNIEHTKIKVTVRINWKWPNLDCPFLSGRKTRNVSCNHQTLYSLGGVRVPAFEVWLVILRPQMDVDKKNCKFFGVCSLLTCVDL